MAREATWLTHDGGHVALDLVNTVSWRGDPDRFVERLDSPSALATWTTARGLPTVATASARDLARLRELREAIHAIVVDRAPNADHGATDPATAVETLRAAAAAAVVRADLDLDDGARWRVAVRDARSLHDHLALVAVELLATADPARLHACAAHDCGWVFHDTSRSGTRRWCDAAGCGNRARARRHHARHHRSTA